MGYLKALAAHSPTAEKVGSPWKLLLAQQSQAQPSCACAGARWCPLSLQGSCAGYCHLQSWQVPGAPLVFQGLFAGSKSDITIPEVSWVGEFPHWISVKAILIHNGFSFCVIFPPIMTPHFPEGIQSEWQISLPSLNWPSTASSAPLSKVPTGDRHTSCECQQPSAPHSDRKSAKPELQYCVIPFCLCFLSPFQLRSSYPFPRDWNCQSVTPIASSKELHPILKLQSCKIKKKK